MLAPRPRRCHHRRRSTVALAVSAAMLEMLEPRTLLAGVQLLKDIDPRTRILATPKNLTAVNSTLFFTAQSKLWKTDGTKDGTVKITDDFADAANLTGFNGALYFSAQGKLWKTDGSPTGATAVSTTSPNPRNIVAAGGRMFFRGGDGGGDELWTSDGTAGGTFRVKDIRPGGAGSDVRGVTQVGSRVFFRADDGTSGQELWTSDGTAAGTYLVKDINPGSGDSGPSALANVNGTLFFAATDGAAGFELWKSDGTDAGTVRVKDIRAGSGGSTPLMIQNVNSSAMFLANDGASGFEIWKSDGTDAGTVLVKDIIPGANGAQISNLATAGGLLFFTADDGISGTELWKSDGTAAGTVRVKDLAPGATSSNPGLLTPFGNKMFFIAHDGASGLEPCISDGTDAGTFLLEDVWPGPASPNPESAVVMGDKVYVSLIEDLYVTDGTSAGSHHVANPTGYEPISSGARNFTYASNGITLFSASDGGATSGQELWRTDGTPAGTNLLLDLTPGPGSTDLQQFAKVGSTVYFLANSRLWKSDGTAAGTVMVSNNPLSAPKLIPAGNQLYFIATTPTGAGLWKSDGTSAGTVLVKGGIQNWRLDSFCDVNGTLFFTADSGTTGQELWKSDGTTAGTVMVKDIIPGATSSGPYLLTNVNGTLFFRATDGASGYELWKSNGTAAGTVMVKDIAAGAEGSIIQSLVAMGGALYFTADDRIHGQEVWKSDGTAAGTVLLNDIYAGAHGSSPAAFTVSNGVMYFRADDGIAGSELWKTDGTAAGTVLVKDIVPGPTGSGIARLVPVTSGVVFDSAGAGNTIWRSDGTAGGTFKIYDFLMEIDYTSTGDTVISTGWSSGGLEPINIDPTGVTPSAATPTTSPAAASPSQSLAAIASSSSPNAIIYDGTFPGDKSNTIAAGMSAMRVIYGEVYTTWMDVSVADESFVRRLAREADDAGQIVSLNIEHWRNDNRFDSESIVGWSVEKMAQVIDWMHDERPNVKVGYAGQITHGAYPPPAPGTLAYDKWHASHDRLLPIIQRADLLFPGVYVQEENVANWFPYAEAHLDEAKLYNKPVNAFMWPTYEGGFNVGGSRAVPPEFWRMQLDTTHALADSATVWGGWTDDAPWYEITRDFIANPAPLVPAAPASLAATVNQSTSRITLNWQDKSYNETGFRIERVPAAAAAAAGFAVVGSVGRNVTTWTDEAATPGVQYLYRVVATNAAGDATSNQAAARIRIAPTAPINVSAAPLSTTRIQIDWENSSDDIDSFIVERSTGGGPFASVATPAGDQTTYEDGGLQPGTAYTYRVRAVNGIGQSAPSNEASATTATTNTGLRANWRFDLKDPNVAIDSAAGHDGALAGENGRPAGVTGTLGDALQFDGIDDRVIVPDAADLRFGATDTFTLMAWVNLTSLPNRAMSIVAKARGSAAPYGIAIDASNHWIATSGGAALVGPTATTGWTHVAIVQAQNANTNSRRLYINGVLVAQTTPQAADGLGALWIGGAEGTIEFFAGKIDDVRLYNRQILSNDIAAFAAPHVTVPATAAADVWGIILSAAGDRYEFYDDSVTHAGPQFSRPIDAVGSISFTGGDGDDRLTADFSAGNVIPLYGFTYTGGNGIDALKITGANAADAFSINATQVKHNGAVIGHGGADSIELSNGIFDVTANLGAAKRLHALAGSAVMLNASQDLAQLEVNNAAVTLTVGGAKVIDTPLLTITNGGTLNFTDNDLIWRSGSANALFSMLSTGAMFTSLDNGGINTLGSAPAAAIFGIQGAQTELFSGRSVVAVDLLIKYTWSGDANLDGVIDGGDYGVIDNFVQVPGASGYWNGDFNYDGVIDGGDYGILDNNIQAQTGQL